MARFIMANRLANRGDEGRARSQEALRTFFAGTLSKAASLVSAPDPPAEVARQVMIFDADAAEIEAKRATLPESVILEEEKPRYPMSTRRSPLLTGFREVLLAAAKVSVPGTGTQLGVTIRGQDAGTVQGAEVILFLRSSGGQVLRIPQVYDPPRLTNAKGQHTFTFANKWTPVALVVDPPGRFWGMIHRDLTASKVTVTLPVLPHAKGRVGWWHDTLKASPSSATAGKGIKVGVIDTGVGPHPAVAHVTGVGAFLNGKSYLTAAKAKDSQSHGTHVCGTIGARSATAGQYAGVAPGVDLYCARVFEATGGASQADTANAIDHMSKVVGVHLINMSLGGPASAIEQDAVRRARDLGTLCVCAAGNEGGKVSYPAAYPETVAVSALGLNGWGPDGSIAASAAPADPSMYGTENLYLAGFSNFGPRIETAAPGVGIIAPVPERHGLTAPYASMNGTSMASPAACGRLAVLLAANAKYMASPADETRVDRARAILTKNCRNIELDTDYQGHGVLG